MSLNNKWCLWSAPQGLLPLTAALFSTLANAYIPVRFSFNSFSADIIWQMDKEAYLGTVIDLKMNKMQEEQRGKTTHCLFNNLLFQGAR